MEVLFPPQIRIGRIRTRLEGLRHKPFTNISGQTFAQPTPGGFWRVELDLLSAGVHEHLALSSFLTAMRAPSTTLLPLPVRFLPNDQHGRPLSLGAPPPPYATDQTGFDSDPFDGFRLLAQARHRDSYIDVIKPGLSQLFPGHFITLGERLHQVVKVTHINEQPNRIRVSVMPNIRGGYPTNTTVVVDHLQLRAQMEDADDVEHWQVPHSKAKAVFLEAF